MKVETPVIEHRFTQLMAVAREAGVKMTHQRLEIFREVASSLEHPDAETVFRAVQARMPTVSLDTVYRTLWTLTDLGLITTLGPRHERVRFDANLLPHYHYICTRCGSARDFECAKLDMVRILEAAEGFGSVVAARVEVRGTCGECAKEEAGSRGSTPAPTVRSTGTPSSRGRRA